MIKSEWTQLEYNQQQINSLKKKFNLTEIETKILLARGLRTEKEIQSFLESGSVGVDFQNTIKDTDRATKMIIDSIEREEKIVVYGDYDSDGITATAIAVRLLRAIGANVDFYINDRIKEGYGMCISGIDKIINKHSDVQLVITVDNGIACFDQVKYLKDKGIKVIVTDHHDIKEELPQADVIVNPKRKDDPFEYKHLCGAAVIWRVMGYLYDTYDYDIEFVEAAIDMVALATVTDVVELRGENRYIVTQGLKRMNNKPSKLFKAMKSVMKVSNEIKSGTLGFQFGPLINAVGRMEHDVNEVVEVFCSEDEELIKERLVKYKEINEERKQLTETQKKYILDQVDLNHKIIVVYHPEISEGIIGLIAGILKEEYNRPAIVFTKGKDDNLKGSARSIPAFPIKEGLDQVKELLLGYGGHLLAAGLEIEECQYEAFKEKIIKIADANLSDQDLVRVCEYIAGINKNSMLQEIYEGVARLEPYGAGFEEAYFRIEKFQIKQINFMGSIDPIHLKISTCDNSTIIGWSMRDYYETNNFGKWLEALVNINRNVYKEKIMYQFIIANKSLRAYRE